MHDNTRTLIEQAGEALADARQGYTSARRKLTEALNRKEQTQDLLRAYADTLIALIEDLKQKRLAYTQLCEDLAEEGSPDSVKLYEHGMDKLYIEQQWAQSSLNFFASIVTGLGYDPMIICPSIFAQGEGKGNA